jgi:membrane associated rhomboid family serine protease
VADPQYCYRHPDRETGLSCSECGRPICVDCMTVAPVGIRCPDHAGTRPRAVQTATRPASIAGKRVRRATARRGYVIPEFSVTRTLVIINVLVYLAELASGSGINGDSGWIFQHGALVQNGVYVHDTIAAVPGNVPLPPGVGIGLDHGEWWRLLTAAFLHYGPVHLGLNMLALWWLGSPVEAALGRSRFVLLYLTAGLAGSAGALVLNPNAITVGASGAIFGILGSLLVLEYQVTGSLMGQAMTLIVINLAFSAAFSSNISLGGHVGGLIAGILGTIALVGFRRQYPAVGTAGIVRGAVVVGLAVISVAIAYLQVRGKA